MDPLLGWKKEWCCTDQYEWQLIIDIIQISNCFFFFHLAYGTFNIGLTCCHIKFTAIPFDTVSGKVSLYFINVPYLVVGNFNATLRGWLVEVGEGRGVKFILQFWRNWLKLTSGNGGSSPKIISLYSSNGSHHCLFHIQEGTCNILCCAFN